VVGRFEIWTLTGQRRVVANQVGSFVHWRADGTAAIVSADPTAVLLIDPVTGGTTPFPGGLFPVADVVIF
jgi:formylmethanofuran:tetrahydromethanopterin formyltransferase